MKLLFSLLSKITGANTKFTPKTVILDQLKETRPLPLGMQEFELWSDRIISGSELDAEADGVKFALATMILHLGPQDDHMPDAYFIKSLRKSAANQIAHARMTQLKEAQKARAVANESVQDQTVPRA